MRKTPRLETTKDIDQLLTRLFPICRSLTGNGVRETLSILKEYIPLTVTEAPSGTKAFDWTVPKEWNINDAYIKDPAGKKIIDFKKSNLHVVSYSTPVNKKMSLAELDKHLHSLPEQPDIIPYKTSYYQPNWGFCLSHRQRKTLKKGTYEVVIDSSLTEGALTYGELLVPGKERDEILVSTYLCHPSLANDNLSGIVLTAFLAKELLERNEKPRYSYRFLFMPETIGAIVWLSRNKARTSRIKHGMVATCVGDAGPFTYKRSRLGNAPIDRAASLVLRDSGKPHNVIDFFPSGSDERQFCSPGFNLPVGCLTRTLYGKYPAYHTSADDLSFISAAHLIETAQVYQQIYFVLERDAVYKNQNPFCEPQLGKRGLYSMLGPAKNEGTNETAMLWVLNMSDGKHSLVDIALLSAISFETIRHVADLLVKHKLLKEVPRRS